MAYKDLREFMARLEKSGELKRISAEVDPVLEITEITAPRDPRRRPGAALRAPQRLARSPAHQHAGQRAAHSIWRWRSIRSRKWPSAFADFWTCRRRKGCWTKSRCCRSWRSWARSFPKTVKTGPCKEVIRRDGFSLLEFPILQCWPQDAGRFITWPLVITRNPETGKRNVGVYRMQVYDETHHGHALANAKARRGTFSPRARGQSATAASTWPWPSAPTRSPAWPASCPFRPTWTR